MKPSKIGWTDFSGGDLNFVTGCTPISEGCKNCYARRIYDRFGRDFSQVTFHADKLARLQRKRFPKYSPKRGEGYRPMAFVVDTGDLFHPDVTDEQIEAAFRVMIERDDVVWQVLTKRAERMQLLLSFWHGIGTYPLYYPPNIWLGVTVENQRCADERIPLLMQAPAQVRFISAEPLLEAIDISSYLGYNAQNEEGYDGQRADTLRIGQSGRMEDRRAGTCMEAKTGAMDQGRETNAAGIFASQENAKWNSDPYGGTPVGMDALQRDNPTRARDQSQEWNQKRQPSRESRDCNGFRERQTRFFDRAETAVGRDESSREAFRCASPRNSGEVCAGGSDAGISSETIRGKVSDYIGYCQGAQADKAIGANGRLYQPPSTAKCKTKREGTIHLVIVGAESGPSRRCFDVQWAVDLYEQCRGAGVYFFGKQDSDLYPGNPLVLPGYGVVHEWPEEDMDE